MFTLTTLFGVWLVDHCCSNRALRAKVRNVRQQQRHQRANERSDHQRQPKRRPNRCIKQMEMMISLMMTIPHYYQMVDVRNDQNHQKRKRSLRLHQPLTLMMILLLLLNDPHNYHYHRQLHSLIWFDHRVNLIHRARQEHKCY
jgi:hypothetical protein